LLNINWEGANGETPEASRDGAWGGVFPPINMVIANPGGAKRKLNRE